jgi:tetratricopeptide (TPR) repeat protein
MYGLADVEAAAERLLRAARHAGDRPSARQAVFFLCASGVFGPTTVDEALSATQGRFRALAQGPIEHAAVEHIEGLLRAMRGECDEGRRLIRNARASFAEFGLRLSSVSTARDEALVARYAGDPAEIERVLRPACDELRTIGETSVLSTEIGELADALYELGRYDEADEASRESERLAQPADGITHVTWRRVRAKLLGRQGERDDALRLAREAVEWADTRLEELGDAYRDLAEVERMTGHADRAEAALEQALATYEQKGIVPMAERTRRQLAQLRANV